MWRLYIVFHAFVGMNAVMHLLRAGLSWHCQVFGTDSHIVRRSLLITFAVVSVTFWSAKLITLGNVGLSQG